MAKKWKKITAITLLSCLLIKSPVYAEFSYNPIAVSISTEKPVETLIGLSDIKTNFYQTLDLKTNNNPSDRYKFTILSTAVNMATAVCYGQYATALKTFGLGIATFAVQYACSTISFIKNTFTQIGEAIKNTTSQIIQGIGTIVKPVVDVYNSILSACKSFGDWLYNPTKTTWTNTLGGLIKGYIGGSIASSVTRYFCEEANQTRNWLSKVGIYFAGAVFLLPITSISSTLDIQTHTDTILELQYNMLSTMVSNEFYKTMESKDGESWYQEFCRACANTMIGSMFDVVKNVNKVAIRTAEYRESLERINDLAQKISVETRDNEGNYVSKAYFDRIKDENWELQGYDENNELFYKYGDLWVREIKIVPNDEPTIKIIYDPSTNEVVDVSFNENWFEYYKDEFLDDTWSEADLMKLKFDLEEEFSETINNDPEIMKMPIEILLTMNSNQEITRKTGFIYFISEKIKEAGQNIMNFWREKTGQIEWDKAREKLIEINNSARLKYEIPSYLSRPSGDLAYAIDDTGVTSIGDFFKTPDGYYSYKSITLFNCGEKFITVANDFLNELGNGIRKKDSPDVIVDNLGNRYTDATKGELACAIFSLIKALGEGVNSCLENNIGVYKLTIQRKGDVFVGTHDEYRYYLQGYTIVEYDSLKKKFKYAPIAIEEPRARELLGLEERE